MVSERCFCCSFCAFCMPCSYVCHLEPLEGGCPPRREMVQWVSKTKWKLARATSSHPVVTTHRPDIPTFWGRFGGKGGGILPPELHHRISAHMAHAQRSNLVVVVSKSFSVSLSKAACAPDWGGQRRNYFFIPERYACVFLHVSIK